MFMLYPQQYNCIAKLPTSYNLKQAGIVWHHFQKLYLLLIY